MFFLYTSGRWVRQSGSYGVGGKPWARFLSLHEQEGMVRAVCKRHFQSAVCCGAM